MMKIILFGEMRTIPTCSQNQLLFHRRGGRVDYTIVINMLMTVRTRIAYILLSSRHCAGCIVKEPEKPWKLSSLTHGPRKGKLYVQCQLVGDSACHPLCHAVSHRSSFFMCIF